MGDPTERKPVVLVVAQAFKGSFDAMEVAARMGAGVVAAGAEPRVVLASDGGDGLLEALSPRLVWRHHVAATGPLGEPLSVPVGWLSATEAVVETRLICGLSLLEPEWRQPLRTTTRGVGEVVSALAREGAREVYLGLGGSATVDGGVGMARAWGWTPLDEAGMPLDEGGGSLAALVTLEPGVAPSVGLVGLCDVTNPLTGPQGARVYARQKGASPEDEERLAEGLETLAASVGRPDLAGQRGAGSAGGLGFGILVFGRGRLESGAKWVLDRTPFADALQEADLVVAGEGSFDATSLDGKLTGEVLGAAARRHVPVLIVAPTVESAPDGVHVECGGGRWSASALETKTASGVGRVFRLLPP